MKYPTIGTVSSGTVRTEDLLEAFSDELERLARANRAAGKYRQLIKDARTVDANSEAGDELTQSLMDALGEFAPPYFYFGTTEGDGSDFGFWLGDLSEFDGLRVCDTSEIPRGHTGEVLHINDHGNATLYACTRGRCREVWAVV